MQDGGQAQRDPNFVRGAVQPTAQRAGDAMTNAGNSPLLQMLAGLLMQKSAPTAAQRKGTTTSQQVGPYKGPMADSPEIKRLNEKK